MNMLWCQGAQNIGLSNDKLKFTLTCTVWSQCTLVPDRQTDRRTNITTTAFSVVLMDASRAKKLKKPIQWYLYFIYIYFAEKKQLWEVKGIWWNAHAGGHLNFTDNQVSQNYHLFMLSTSVDFVTIHFILVSDSGYILSSFKYLTWLGSQYRYRGANN